MYSFQCLNCFKTHHLQSLIEFPQPEMISDISSGKIKKELILGAKNMFNVNNEYLITQVELIINITDYEDQLEFLVWFKTEIKEVKIAVLRYKDSKEIILKGNLIHEIPIYKNTENLPVELSITPDSFNVPKVSNIERDIKLKKDFTEGIKLKELIILYSEICKLANM